MGFHLRRVVYHVPVESPETDKITAQAFRHFHGERPSIDAEISLTLSLMTSSSKPSRTPFLTVNSPFTIVCFVSWEVPQKRSAATGSLWAPAYGSLFTSKMARSAPYPSFIFPRKPSYLKHQGCPHLSQHVRGVIARRSVDPEGNIDSQIQHLPDTAYSASESHIA